MSFAITSIVSAILVILKETNEETLLSWMKAATGHHWVTHGILDHILFMVPGWALSRPNGGQGVNPSTNGFISCFVAAIVVSGLLIAGFYILH